MSHIKNPAPIMLCWTAAAHAQAGDINGARDAATRFITIAEAKLSSAGSLIPGSWMEFIAQRFPARQDEDREHFLDGLRKAGVPE